MRDYNLLVSIYTGIVKPNGRYKHRKRNIDLVSLHEFNITNWYVFNAIKANWFLLKAVDFDDNPDSYVIGDFCDFKINEINEYTDKIDFNPKYLQEFKEILKSMKAKSKIGAVIVLFRLERGDKVEGVLLLEDFMDSLVKGELEFNVAYLIN